ncbi:L-lysine 2-3-aminomutase [Penicillium sp. CMV-2018d]|nr:L-lysine 2-3-aminomutase [Penicillium sp. CMV-2018d]
MKRAPLLLDDTYDHRVWKTGLPVRSAVLKPHAGELVVGWVTTSESSLLYSLNQRTPYIVFAHDGMVAVNRGVCM